MRDKVFFYHIGVVENFVNVGYIDDDSILRCSVEFLEKLTQVKSKAIEQRDFFYNPSKQNIKDWKKWFRKNKESLYWDENEHKLKLLRTQSSLL